MDTITIYTDNEDGSCTPRDYKVTSTKRVSWDALYINFHVPEIGNDVAAVIFDDGGIFTPRDWQAPQPGPDEVGNPEYRNSWIYVNGNFWSDVVAVVNGLPRLLPGALIYCM